MVDVKAYTRSGSEKPSKLIEDTRRIMSQPTLTESEIQLVKTRMNSNKVKMSDYTFRDGGYDLTPSQVEKGRKYLLDLWKTPSGQERKNNPFGYREQRALETFETIRLIDWYPAENYYMVQAGIHNYQPYYEVVGKEQDFQYTVVGGEVQILG